MNDAIKGIAVDLQVGDVRITRIEESYEPAFPVNMMLPLFERGTAEEWGPSVLNYFDASSELALTSVHSWLVRTPRSTILVDTCTGNHKDRPLMEAMHQLNVPFLARLEAAGVKREQVDYVICTHLHLDHCGWNTMLVDGEWVPTFPNARYVVNRTEFDFWDPTNPANEQMAWNGGVFEDSVKPVFDRDLVQFWDGDTDIDEVFHLEMATGHSEGHCIAMLESKGERALFAGDSMHSPLQVFEPSWFCGFDAVPDQATATRRRVLELCADKGALLLPAHFSAPHVYRVEARGNGLQPVPAYEG